MSSSGDKRNNYHTRAELLTYVVVFLYSDISSTRMVGEVIIMCTSNKHRNLKCEYHHKNNQMKTYQICP